MSENYKYIKIIKIVLVVLLLIGIYFMNYFHNIKKDGDIAIAKQTLYEVTQVDRVQIQFQLESSDSGLNDEKKQCYSFKVLNKTNEEYDFNYLVKKDSFKVYVCDKKGFVIPYEDYINNDTILGNYFEELKKIDYDDMPPATKNYFEKNGGINFLEKVEEIIEVTNEAAVEQWGGIVQYVDLIMNGANPKSLNEGF